MFTFCLSNYEKYVNFLFITVIHFPFSIHCCDYWSHFSFLLTAFALFIGLYLPNSFNLMNWIPVQLRGFHFSSMTVKSCCKWVCFTTYTKLYIYLYPIIPTTVFSLYHNNTLLLNALAPRQHQTPALLLSSIDGYEALYMLLCDVFNGMLEGSIIPAARRPFWTSRTLVVT